MGTVGTASFYPSGRFAFPRSFITDFVLFKNFTNLVQHDNIFDLDLLPASPAIFRVTVDPDFWFWNSNARTLDHIIIESWYKPTGAGAEVPMDYFLSWNRYPAGTPSTLFYYPSSSGIDPVRFTIPSSPGSYWAPPT
jgi:hypothetical protein